MNDQEENMDRPLLRIPVRGLVEFLLRSGDIDEGAGTHDPLLSMREGARIHKKIQKSMGPSYHAEVPLQIKVTYPSLDLMIEGRADGVFMEKDESLVPTGVDEIKGVYMDLDKLSGPIPVHLAQAKVYAFILSEEYALSSLTIQMTYCNLDTEEIKRFRSTFSKKKIDTFFYDLVGRYEKWAEFQVKWGVVSKKTIKSLPFPYPLREGQGQLMDYVYRTIWHKKKLFIEAPTGTGKTLAVLYPSIKALGEGLARRIFYLTGKTVTKAVARDTSSLLMEKGLKLKVVDITARAKICPLLTKEAGEGKPLEDPSGTDEAGTKGQDPPCRPDECPYARGHYDRVNKVLYDLITGKDFFDRKTILAAAEEGRVCPFELSLDLADFSDLTICDYNYAFDPTASLKRFFIEGQKADSILLIDEAHNLIDRGRRMYSKDLSKIEVLRVRRAMKPLDPKAAKALSGLNQALLSLKRSASPYTVLSDLAPVLLPVRNTVTALRKFFEKGRIDQNADLVRTFYFNLKEFLSLGEKADGSYLTWGESLSEDFILHLSCIDPAALLTERMNRGLSSILFSATLLPMSYYKDLITTEERPYAVYASSIFKRDQRAVYISADVTSLYKKRGPKMYERYAEYLYAMAGARRGNYLAFFPSYAFLNEVYKVFIEKHGDEVDTLAQKREMGEAEREAFLSRFTPDEEKDKSLLGFTVLGGIFAEGIDLTGESLLGAAIIGTGLPQVSKERDLMRDYFEKRGKDGFNYAYLYPGAAKVLQAAGRVIRTEKDKGVILLLDSRFLTTAYRRTFPREWADAEEVTIRSLPEKLKEFWEKD